MTNPEPNDLMIEFLSLDFYLFVIKSDFLFNIQWWYTERNGLLYTCNVKLKGYRLSYYLIQNIYIMLYNHSHIHGTFKIHYPSIMFANIT